MKPIIIRTSELKDYKKCQFKWYLRWRLGYKFKRGDATALQFGTWIHAALELWRNDPWYGLCAAFETAIADTMTSGVVNSALHAKLDEYREMGLALLTEYERVYRDERVDVIGTEIELSTAVPRGATLHMKLDLVYRDAANLIWIRDYKTTKQWSLDHLMMDDQTAVYLCYAEEALKAQGILAANERVHGMQYDYLRKGVPDERPRNALGQALNNDGTVSKRQGSPLLKRVPIVRTRDSLAKARRRLGLEFFALSTATENAREIGRQFVHMAPKTATFMCASTCEFFNVCKAHEEGISITEMLGSDFKRENPYVY